MQEIIDTCKCGVYLTINENRDYYETVEEYIQDVHVNRIDKELADRMIKENCIVSLQFYPDTPVSSYTVYGTTVNEVILKALEILRK